MLYLFSGRLIYMLKNAFEFYYKAAQLKDMLRQGAVQWSVNKERLESIAEHTFGCMILAISLHSELNLNLNLGKTLEMLTIHELEELFIGDITPLDNVNKEELKLKAKTEVSNFVKVLNKGKNLISLTEDFNLSLSDEAKFAKAIDKLECVLEFKKYEDLGQVSLSHLTPEMLKNKYLKAYVDEGRYSLADIFFLYHMPAFKEFGINEKFWFETLKQLNIN